MTIKAKTLEERFEKFFRLYYMKDLLRVARFYPEKRSLIVDFDTLETYDFDLGEIVLNDPLTSIREAEKAIRNIELPIDLPSIKVNVRFKNIPNSYMISDLGRAHLIGKFVSFEGVITSISEIKSKLFIGAFECDKCGYVERVPQNEDLEKLVTPYVCYECGGKRFTLLREESVYRDIQYLKVQEEFEKAPGSQPREVLVVLEDDLTTERLVGTRVKINGVVLVKHKKRSQVTSKYILCNYIELDESSIRNVFIPEGDVKKIHELARDPEIYSKLCNSIAPHIYGLKDIKTAVLLQLFGAPPVYLPDGGVIRGDSHILIIGEPAVGKSDILEAISRILGIPVNEGPGATGVGLTAAAVQDKDTGTWTLRAGPLVLSDGLVCLIDEFDKMDPNDRKKIHRVMEQQKITIAKAGITAEFKARCGILAAANPKLGRFDWYKPIAEQLNLPPTILSRFDLIFLISDSPEALERKTQHILRISAQRAEERAPPVPPELLRKYILYARRNCRPEMTQEAIEAIESFFSSLLSAYRDNDTLPITARQVWGLIRLARASARVRLSEKVTKFDAELAIRLVKLTLQQFGIDLETGKMDIDKIMVGVTKSQRERLRIIHNIIRELEDIYGYAKEAEIFDEAEKQGLKKTEALEAIEKLKRDGDIYEPKPGGYKTV